MNLMEGPTLSISVRFELEAQLCPNVTIAAHHYIKNRFVLTIHLSHSLDHVYVHSWDLRTGCNKINQCMRVMEGLTLSISVWFGLEAQLCINVAILVDNIGNKWNDTTCVACFGKTRQITQHPEADIFYVCAVCA